MIALVAEEKKAHDTTPVVAGVVAGAAGGALTTHSMIKDYLQENLERDGAFDALQQKLRDQIEDLAGNDVLQQSFEGSEPLFDELGKYQAQYRSACNKEIERRGLNNWSGAWKHLEQGQKNKTLIFAGAAALGIGAVSYVALDRWLNTKHDASPAR